jgi:hypothetical protein
VRSTSYIIVPGVSVTRHRVSNRAATHD